MDGWVGVSMRQAIWTKAVFGYRFYGTVTSAKSSSVVYYGFSVVVVYIMTGQSFTHNEGKHVL